MSGATAKNRRPWLEHERSIGWLQWRSVVQEWWYHRTEDNKCKYDRPTISHIKNNNWYYCSHIIDSAPCVTCDTLSDLQHPDKPKWDCDKRKIFGHDIIFLTFFAQNLRTLGAFWNFVTLWPFDRTTYDIVTSAKVRTGRGLYDLWVVTSELIMWLQ